MSKTKKPVRLVDIGELEEDLYEALDVSARKADSDDVITCGEAISCEIEDLRNLPTIDPKSLRPVAHWENDPNGVDSDVFTCSNCCERICLEDQGFFPEMDYKFCPYCGARMEGVSK